MAQYSYYITLARNILRRLNAFGTGIHVVHKANAISHTPLHYTHTHHYTTHTHTHTHTHTSTHAQIITLYVCLVGWLVGWLIAAIYSRVLYCGILDPNTSIEEKQFILHEYNKYIQCPQSSYLTTLDSLVSDCSQIAKWICVHVLIHIGHTVWPIRPQQR